MTATQTAGFRKSDEYSRRRRKGEYVNIAVRKRSDQHGHSVEGRGEGGGWAQTQTPRGHRLCQQLWFCMCSTCEILLWGKQEGRGKDGGPESWVQFRLPRVWERVTGQPGVRELVLSASPTVSQGRSLPSGLRPALPSFLFG